MIIRRNLIRTVIIIFMFNMILSACLSQEKPAKKIYTILENVTLAEKDFEKVQDPLIKTEENEKATYDQIIILDKTQYDQKVKLSNDALKMVSVRKKYMVTETKSMQESEKEFKKVASLKEKVADKKLKEQAQKLYDLMISRYRAHDVLAKEYLQGTSEDKKLYEMFKDRRVSVQQLEAQIDKINSIYKNIYSDNDKFNLLTQRYNDQKLQFYKSAELIKN